MRTLKRGKDNHMAERDIVRSNAHSLAMAGTEGAAASATALALLSIESQFARFNDAIEEFLRMAKDERSDG